MKRNTTTQKVPSTREESLNMIIRKFLDSDERQIRLVLYPQEIPLLEEHFPQIVVHYKNIYQYYLNMKKNFKLKKKNYNTS